MQELKFVEAHLDFKVMRKKLPKHYFPEGIHFREVDDIVEPSKKPDFLAKKDIFSAWPENHPHATDRAKALFKNMNKRVHRDGKNCT